MAKPLVAFLRPERHEEDVGPLVVDVADPGRGRRHDAFGVMAVRFAELGRLRIVTIPERRTPGMMNSGGPLMVG